MTLSALLKLARQNWYLLAAPLIVGLVAGLAYVVVAQRQYESTSKVFVSTGSASSLADLNQGSTYTQQVVKSYAELATTPYVLNQVITSEALPTNAADLAHHVTATAPIDTVVIQVTVQEPNPAQAATIANSVARTLASAVDSLTPQTTLDSDPVKITQIQTALPNPLPVNPRPLLDVAAAGIAGLLAGALLVAFRRALDTTVRGAPDLAEVSDLPILAEVELLKGIAEGTRPLMGISATPQMEEQYRKLRTSLRFLAASNERKSFVITSSIPSEGKTTTTLNLGIAMADAGSRVLLVDADLRRPTLADALGLDGGIGLSDVLANSVPPEDAIQTWGTTGSLNVMCAGELPPNPNELLQSVNMTMLHQSLSAAYDVILYDAPPVLPVSDSSILGSLASGVILISAAGRIKRTQVRAALETLNQLGVVVFGFVINRASVRELSSYGYGYRYGYGPGVGTRLPEPALKLTLS